MENIIQLMSGPEGNSFVFPRSLMFPSTLFRQTSKLEEKQNLLCPEGQGIKCFVI